MLLEMAHPIALSDVPGWFVTECFIFLINFALVKLKKEVNVEIEISVEF